MKAFCEAIKVFGTVSNLARAVGVSRQVIDNAKRRKSVSPSLAESIERATQRAGKKVAKERLVWDQQAKTQPATSRRKAA